jgi:hypothetical protein
MNRNLRSCHQSRKIFGRIAFLVHLMFWNLSVFHTWWYVLIYRDYEYLPVCSPSALFEQDCLNVRMNYYGVCRTQTVSPSADSIHTQD